MKRLTTVLLLLCIMGTLFAFDIGETGSTININLNTSTIITGSQKIWIAKNYADSDITEAQTPTLANSSYDFDASLWWEIKRGSPDNITVSFTLTSYTLRGSGSNTIETAINYPTANRYMREGTMNAGNNALGTAGTINDSVENTFKFKSNSVTCAGRIPFSISATEANVLAAAPGNYTATVKVKVTEGA